MFSALNNRLQPASVLAGTEPRQWPAAGLEPWPSVPPAGNAVQVELLGQSAQLQRVTLAADHLWGYWPQRQSWLLAPASTISRLQFQQLPNKTLPLVERNHESLAWRVGLLNGASVKVFDSANQAWRPIGVVEVAGCWVRSGTDDSWLNLSAAVVLFPASPPIDTSPPACE